MLNEKTLSIDSDSAQLKLLRDQAAAYLKTLSLPEEICEKLLVAVGEAAANSVRHSYAGQKGHEVRLTIQNFPDRVVFRVRDFGKKIDLSKIKEPELPPVKPNGLGIHFMKTIMDEFQYNTGHAEGNELIMTKFKPQSTRSQP